MSSDDGWPPRPSGSDPDADGPEAGDPVAGTAAGAGVAGEGPKGPSPHGSSAHADDGLDAWMAAHFPPPQTGDDDDAENAGTADGPAAGAATGAGVDSESPQGHSPLGSGARSALDDVFGETEFRDYDTPPGAHDGETTATRVLGSSALLGSSAAQGSSDALTVAVARVRPRREGISRRQVVLLWVGGALIALLAIVTLFVIGTRVPALLGPAPAVFASSTPTPTPTPTTVPVGPVAPGEHAWDDLFGGECLDPYTGPWAESFTVVDCSADHAAQLVTRGTFEGGDGPQALYPGPDALQAQINLLCTAPTVIDYPAAGKYSDIQFAASYAATPQEWAEGQHDYFCFVSRSSGGPVSGTLAVPQAPKPSPSPSA